MRLTTLIVASLAALSLAACSRPLNDEDRYPEGEFVRQPDTEVLVPTEDGRLEVDPSKEPATEVVVPARTFGNEDAS